MIEAPKFNTYLATAKNLIDENPKFYTKPEQKGMLSFAKYLDSGREPGAELQMLALHAARKIDGEVLQECIETFGREPMVEVVRRVYGRHKHTKSA